MMGGGKVSSWRQWQYLVYLQENISDIMSEEDKGAQREHVREVAEIQQCHCSSVVH